MQKLPVVQLAERRPGTVNILNWHFNQFLVRPHHGQNVDLGAKITV